MLSCAWLNIISCYTELFVIKRNSTIKKEIFFFFFYQNFELYQSNFQWSLYNIFFHHFMLFFGFSTMKNNFQIVNLLLISIRTKSVIQMLTTECWLQCLIRYLFVICGSLRSLCFTQAHIGASVDELFLNRFYEFDCCSVIYVARIFCSYTQFCKLNVFIVSELASVIMSVLTSSDAIQQFQNSAFCGRVNCASSLFKFQ